jgi:hypothetical protein
LVVADTHCRADRFVVIALKRTYVESLPIGRVPALGWTPELIDPQVTLRRLAAAALLYLVPRGATVAIAIPVIVRRRAASNSSKEKPTQLALSKSAKSYVFSCKSLDFLP